MLIFRGRAADDVKKEINSNIEQGNYELIFKNGAYMLVRILHEVQ